MNDYQDLIIFLAQTVDKMAESREKALNCQDFENMRGVLALDFPVVQGMEAQGQIRDIGNHPYDCMKAQRQGVKFLKEMKKNDKS